MTVRRICIFCGSSPGARACYGEAARAIGAALARRGLGLVYGGGRVGLMGIVADAVIAGGGEVIGVIPSSMVSKEVAHLGLTELRVVGSMHERKALMAEMADAFIALPGGYGTFEEFCEIVTWAQLGLHRKPCGLLNVGGYYDALLLLFDRALSERFVRPAHRALVLEERHPDRLLDRLSDYEAPSFERWLELEET